MKQPQPNITCTVNQKHTCLKTSLLIATLGIIGSTGLSRADAAQEKPAAPATQPAGLPASQGFSGKVVETMNAASYTYVLVDTGSKKLWAAAPQFQVKVGDAITIEGGLPMEKYHSKTLNRDFEVVYFTGRALVGGAQASAALPSASLPEGHPPLTGAAAPAAKIDFAGLKKAAGGKTVSEIYAVRPKLAGQKVAVRGKVVKYNAMIMGKNWLHLQDGTGTPGSNDLTVTTVSEAKVGNTIVATGTIAIDKDFGAGYKFSVILEDAKVVVESK
jgi:hypothetical protein